MIRPVKRTVISSDKVVQSLGKNGRIKIILRKVALRLPGKCWQTFDFPWVVVDRGDSVAILIHNVNTDEVVLVEQFRPAVNEATFEIVAGTVEGNESLEDCVRREVKEEVGLEVEKINCIATVFSSPGYTSEKVYIYRASVSSLGEDGLEGGLKSEGEHITKHVVTLNEALDMIEAGIIKDAKTIIALQFC